MEDDLEQAMKEALEDNPRSEDLTEMIVALTGKREGCLLDLATASEEREKSLKAHIREMDKQIEILREELAITQFVEYEVRAAVLKAQSEGGWEETT